MSSFVNGFIEVGTIAPHLADLASAWITDQCSNRETIILINDTFDYFTSI